MIFLLEAEVFSNKNELFLIVCMLVFLLIMGTNLL